MNKNKIFTTLGASNHMEKMKDLIKYFWFFITHPSYWTMNYPYNEDYDRWFNELLDNNEFKKPVRRGVISPEYYVYLGDELFWFRNQPYACFISEYSSFNTDNNTKRRFRPSRKTIYKAIKKFKKEC